MSKLVYLNDRFIREEDATISASDLGFERGYAIFDFFRLVGNQPLHLEDHLDRFFYSAEQMRLPVPKSRDDIRHIIREMIWENELPNSGIRIQLSGGDAEVGSGFPSPTLIISQLPFPFPPSSMIEEGIKLVTYQHQRQLPQVKTTDYLMHIWLQPYLKENNAHDILYCFDGLITESPRSNFFTVTKDDKLVTAGNRVLKGITRKKLIDLASAHYSIEERDLKMEEIGSAKEAFITSTTKQIIPVVQVDGKQVGDGKPGGITQHLMRMLREHTGISL